MGDVKNKKSIPLSLFYLKYFACLFLGILAVVFIAAIVFNMLVLNDIVYPANYAEKQAKAASSGIAGAEEVSEDLIPELCQYIVFDINGEVKAGNIGKSGIKNAWRAVQENVSSISGYYYTVIERDAEYCVLRYEIVPQYKSPALRRYLAAPQNLLFVSIVCLILLMVIITAICFGHTLRNKLSPLISATEKIQNQELEFAVMPSDIKEIAAVLKAVDDMRAALKKSLESQWKLEQTKKEQTLALAHDLKTPLTLVRGNAELLYDTALTDEQREYVDYIENGSLQMQNYVQTLIEITRDSYKLRLQNVSIAPFLQEIMEQIKGLCVVKDIRIQELYKYEAQYFSIDHDLLMRALINVFSNAVEYTKTGGTIFFEVNEENNYIVFSVSDTGNGFSAEALKHATEQFYMNDRSRNSKSHFGIGLYMADLVIKQHNGQLILENSQKTGGAKVTMKILLKMP